MFKQLLERCRNAGDYAELVDTIPYAQTIGMSIVPLGEDLVFRLEKRNSNIGMPNLPAIHGGVMGGFMEASAIFQTMIEFDLEHLPKTVDFSIDYLRPGLLQDTYARCETVRQGRKIINLSIFTWQTRRDTPIATARCHFLIDGNKEKP